MAGWLRSFFSLMPMSSTVPLWPVMDAAEGKDQRGVPHSPVLDTFAARGDTAKCRWTSPWGGDLTAEVGVGNLSNRLMRIPDQQADRGTTEPGDLDLLDSPANILGNQLHKTRDDGVFGLEPIRRRAWPLA
ncbi:hypothetical protein LY76DRAFT_604488 [Colletotrichum caudatum]|nr:hypothetical protein LY76DRAFT_604488 [Colletotrichum caudatum]